MKNITMIIDRFDASIRKIEKSNLQQLAALNQKIKITKECLDELRNEVKTNSFSTEKKEIQFFKYQKPYIKGRLKFYLDIYRYLLNKPVGSKSAQRKFVNLQISQLYSENCYYVDFVKYYRLEETKLDKSYFMRGIDQFNLFIDNTSIYEDPDFSTSRDHLASKLIAQDLLVQFYTNELEALKKKKDKNFIQEVQTEKPFNIKWTASKTDLIELLLALKELGAIDNGNSSIKKMKDFSKFLFKEDFGNFYKTFNEIKSRGNDQTKFLDKLKLALTQKIKSDDES